MPINFADIIEQINRDANVTGSGYFPLVHSANIDFTVEGIVGADASRYDATTFVSTYGTKYIITASDNWSPPPYGNQFIDGGNASDWFALKANSIVQRGSSSWKTFTDVTNTKSNQGIVVFNKYDNKIYVYSGTEWVQVGSGSLTGAAGEEWSVQFRASNGSLSGSSGLLFDNTSKKLVLGSGVVLQFADGSTQGTARNFFSAEAEINYPVGGFSASGFTGDRLLLATGPANDPFRNYIRYENQWFQTGVVGVGPQSITGDTISAGYGIDIDRDGNSVTVNNIGVTGFNGLAGNVSMTGAGALVGRNNNIIDARLASTSLTGVASFASGDFAVSATGHVTVKVGGIDETQLASGAKPKIANLLDLNNASINEGTFIVYDPGREGYPGHPDYNPQDPTVDHFYAPISSYYSPKFASASVTGVASFNSANFTISATGHVGLTGVVKTINGNAPDGDGNYSVSVGATVTGDSGALGGDGVRITARLASASLTGVASFDPRYFTVATTGHVGLLSAYQVTGQTVVSGGGSQTVNTSGNIATIDNRIATDSLTGVASFNSTYLTVSNGEVSLASAYQVTGQTVVAGGSSQIVNTSGNTVTIDNRVATSSLTGVASFNSTFFTVSGTGHVSISDTYQQIGNGVTGISAGVGIAISGPTGYVVIANTGVLSVAGDEVEVTATNGDGGNTGHISISLLAPIARRSQANTYEVGLQKFTTGLSASGGITFGGHIAIGAGSTASVRGSVNFPNLTNTTKSHRSNNALGTDTGTARKIAMLAADGSLTFDYIRNYDVFKPTDFTFSVGSFSSSISNPILIGNQSYSLNTSSFYGSDLVNGPALTAGMYINTANQGSGFPVYANILSDGGLTFAPGAVSITAGVAGSVQIKLIATGPDEVNGGTTASTKTITFSLFNDFLYGVTSASSLTGGGFTGTWVTYITSNSRQQSFPVTLPSDHYVYYAHPQRLGESVNQIDNVGIGGLGLQGYGNITGASVNSYGNRNGYVENYLFYRSNNPSLGLIQVDTGANAGEL